MGRKSDIVGGGEDRPLDGADLERIAAGKEPKGGNGSYIPFDKLPPATLAEYRERGRQTKLANRHAKQLATLEGFIEAHRARAVDVFGAKLEIIEGLMAEAVVEVEDPKTGEVVRKFNTRYLPDARLKILLNALKDFEFRGFAAPAAKVEHEHSGQVDMMHQFAEVQKRIEGAMIDAEVVGDDD